MKIAVPWPVRSEGQPRIKEALSLWENPEPLALCLVRPCDDDFILNFPNFLLSRDSTDIGTKVQKCYISDMLEVIRQNFPDEDWYGFGNSDCVPVGDLIEGHTDYQALIYHRTDIKEWPHRLKSIQAKPIPVQLADRIWRMRQEGKNDKQIAKELNRAGEPLPPGCQEWTYALIRELFEEQGRVFFWGQDLFLFQAGIIDQVIEHLRTEANDPILGTGGFDPRLTYWCFQTFKSAQVLNKIFHKEHQSEWTVDEVEYHHNGGDIILEQKAIYYGERFIQSFCEQGQKGAVPRYIKYLVGRNDPDLFTKLFGL